MSDFTQLENFFRQYPAFRLEQAKKAIFQDLISDWEMATVFPRRLREELNEKFPLRINARILSSENQETVKALMKLEDDLDIESVLMKHKEKRNTVCVSSQAGCPLSCTFCATGKSGFKRNLTAGEVVEQVLFFARHLKKIGGKVTNIVFMGMGEPFLNYDNVIAAIKTLHEKDGFNLGWRHFSISTAGIPEGIRRLAREKMQVNLAVSLHAPDDSLRSRIMPINKKYPLKELFKAVDDYIKAAKRRVMFEYIMIKGINDSPDCARKLARLMQKPLYFVNLIAYNPTGLFQPSSAGTIKNFRIILEKEGVAVTQRYRFGRDIDAACGQLGKIKTKFSLWSEQTQ